MYKILIIGSYICIALSLTQFVSTSPTPTSVPFIGGVLGGEMNDGSHAIDQPTIGESIIDLIIDIFKGIFIILTPFFEWGSKTIIIICCIMFYCTRDKRLVTKGMKWFFVYIAFLMMRGVMI